MNVRRILPTVIVTALATTASLGETGVGVVISTIGSERATTGNNNKIDTYDGKTHVVWQDSTTDGYFNRVCTYDHSRAAWSDAVTLNQGRNNNVFCVNGREVRN